MSRYSFKMPDLGEGTVAAEVVAVHVKPGDVVTEEQIIFDVMTEKATVEVPSPVSGRVVSIHGAPGESVAVGAELIVFETDTAAKAEPEVAAAKAPAPTPAARQPEAKASAEPERTGGRVMASPATRRRAHEAGIELTQVPGTGPGGRISRGDFENFVEKRSVAGKTAARGISASGAGEIEEIPVIGIRRVIAQRMTRTVQTIPHFSYVEEVDVTELEALRLHLNTKLPKGAASYTYLPFIALALARVLPAFPQCNVRHDAERNVLLRHRSLHLGIATQTPDGLKVPVVRNVEQRSLADVAAEIRRVSEAARSNKASRDELSGSTLTLTSLGKLGGIASTPIINAPE
ncbi:MAG TPA: dihydrolipoamide acetyltransferase family protein, partial [Povalibacter sp.]|nr:dihydrolipoamide acetyltransferase family protein [Povalibacter sp.]